MSRLRRPHDLARLCARWVMLWFALSLVAAMASPIVHPQAMELVCSTGGVMKLVVKSDDGAQPMAGHTMDCAMCLTVAPPPPMAARVAEPPQPLAHVMQPIAAAHIASLTAAPLPARGPPTFL